MSKILQIAILGPTKPFRGGIAHHTTLLFETLRHKHHVRLYSYLRQYPDLLYPGRTDREPGLSPFIDDDVLYTLDSINPCTWLRTARLISERPLDLFVIPWWNVFWAPAVAFIARYVKRKTQATILFLCHNVRDHDSNPVKDLLTRMTLSAGHAFFCHSDEECSVLRECYPDRLVQKAYHPTYSSLSTMRSKGHNISSSPSLLFFGFIRPYKNLDLLLRALPEINRRTGAVLKVVGEPWNSDDTVEKIRELERTGILSSDLRYVRLEEIPSIFDDTHLVILPYRSATGSGIVQLAFGSGKPVVATNVGGLRDAITDRVNGILVNPEDEHALAEAVIEALSPSIYPKLVSGAKASSMQFSWNGIADMLERVSQIQGFRPMT